MSGTFYCWHLFASKPFDFTNLERMARESAQHFFKNIKEGEGAMPAFGEKLSEDDIWNVIDYLRSFTYRE